MGSAYTPGLTVSGDIVVRRVRRLPIKGEVLVAKGDAVEADTYVARAQLPGLLQTIKLGEKLGCEAKDVPGFFLLKIGDPIAKGQLVAETKGFFGLFGGQKITSDYEGTVESISEVSGNVLIREPSIPVEIDAYIKGRVAEIMPEEGAVIETRGAMIQGIFGVGPERRGTVKVVVQNPGEVLDRSHINESHKGCILIGGSRISAESIKRAAEVGALGLVAGAILDSDLAAYLGEEIGVAITGQEDVPLTLVITEGFGTLSMAERTFNLLKTLEGQAASINGATQIRAGVIRPELIVPLELTGESRLAAVGGGELGIGTPIRIIREPYFGRLGTVTALPPTLEVLESGTEVRVLRAKLENGEEVTVPRANVEITAA